MAQNDGRGALILLYHGVSDCDQSFGIHNFSGKHVSLATFESHLQEIVSRGHPMTLRELVKSLSGTQPLPPRSVVVTFDDSFENFERVALPSLQKFGVPATFFVSTSFVGTDKLYWVDEVEDLINRATVTSINWNHNELHAISTSEEKVAFLNYVKSKMKSSSVPQKDEMIKQLRDKCRATGEFRMLPNYKQMDWCQVLRLHQPPVYEVGGHTHTHEILSYLSDADQKREISQCLNVLRDKGIVTDLFSYPEGQSAHYNNQVIENLKAAGVTICPSAIDGLNYLGESPFHLKRVMPGFQGREFPWEFFKS